MKQTAIWVFCLFLASDGLYAQVLQDPDRPIPGLGVPPPSGPASSVSPETPAATLPFPGEDPAIRQSPFGPSRETLIVQGKVAYHAGKDAQALAYFMRALKIDPNDTTAKSYVKLIMERMKRKRDDPPADARNLEASALPLPADDAAFPPADGISGVNAGGTLAKPMTGSALPSGIPPAQQMRGQIITSWRLDHLPNLKVEGSGSSVRLMIPTDMIFAPGKANILEKHFPILSFAGDWLKAFGNRPIVMHFYPEELVPSDSNDRLFVRRYAELYGYFVDEKKVYAQRFLSGGLVEDRLAQARQRMLAGPVLDLPTSGNNSSAAPTGGESRIVIEVLGANDTASLGTFIAKQIPVAHRTWLAFSIGTNRKVVWPDRGEDVAFDIKAIAYGGVQKWVFRVMDQDGNIVFKEFDGQNTAQRVRWNVRNAKTKEFLDEGIYRAVLEGTDRRGDTLTREMFVEVKRIPYQPSKALQGPAQKKTVPVVKKKKVKKAPSAPSSLEALWRQVIPYDTNAIDLKSASYPLVEKVVRTLSVYPVQKVRLEGFAAPDEDGGADLAIRRAEMLGRFLKERFGVKPERIVIAPPGALIGDDFSPHVEVTITN